MSSNVEERVVEMRFDNAKFEKNAQQTIKTLNALDKSLDLQSSTEGFKNLEKAANSVDLSHLEKSLDYVANKFTLFGKIGDKILTDLSHKFVNFFEKVSKSFTTDQIRSGWSKYEAKTNAVQVIMHSTHMSIDKVSESLEKLNEYTDETSYRFDQMVDAISKFTGAGIGLEDAEKAVEGIANWAATAGVSPEKAASAFYNLSQAMSSGALKAQDWKSIEGLNMNTVEFEETAIRVAKEMIEDGRASKEMAEAFKKADPQVQGFRDSLSKGWLDKDVMTEVFKEYADTTTEFGLKAFKAAQEAKTFRDAVDAAKEAVATGWSKVFEQIFGNYEEAKVFWTNVANEMIDFFSAPVNALANYLKEWHKQGGYVAFINSIHNAWASVKAIGEAVGEVFRNIFPALDPARLVRWTQKLEEVTAGWMKSVTKIDLSEFNEELQELYANGDTAGIVERLTEAEEHNAAVDKKLSPLKDTLQGIFAIIKLTGSLTKALFKIVLPFTKLLVPIANLVGTITGALGRMASAVADAILNSEIFNGILGFLAKVSNAAVSAVNWLSEKLVGLIDVLLHIPIVETFVSLIQQLGQAIKNIAAPYIAKIASAFTSLYNSIKTFVSTHLDAAIKALGNVLMTIGGALIYAAQAVWKFFQPAFTALGTIFKTLYNSIKKFVGKFDLKSVFSDIGKGFDLFIGSISSVANSIWNFVKPAFTWLENALRTVYNAVKDYLESSEFDDILQDIADGFIAFGGAVIYAAKAVWDWLQPAFDAIGGFVSTAWEYIKGFGKKIKDYWDNVIVPSGVFNFLMEKIRELGNTLKNLGVGLVDRIKEGGIAGIFQWIKDMLSDLWKAIKSFNFGRLLGEALDMAKIGGIIAGLVAFYKGAKLVKTAINILGGIPAAIKRFSKGIMIKRVATSILMLAGALYILSQIPADRLWELVGALAALGAILVGFTLALSLVTGILSSKKLIDNHAMKRAVRGLLIMAASILILSVALKKVSEIEPDRLWPAVLAVISVMGALAASAGLLSLAKSAVTQVGLGFLALAAGIIIMLFAIDKVQELFSEFAENREVVEGSVVIISAISIALIGMAVALKFIKKSTYEMAAIIASIGVAVLLIAVSIRHLADLDTDSLIKAGAVLLGLIAAFALLVLASKMIPEKGSKKFMSMAAIITALGLAMLLLALAIRVIGKMDTDLIEKGLVRLIGIMAILSVTMIATRKAQGSFGTFAGLAALIIVIVGSLTYLANQNFDKMMDATLILGSVFVSLGLSLKMGARAFAGQKANIFGISALILTLTIALGLLSFIDIGSLAKASGVIISVFASIIAIASRLKSGAFSSNNGSLFGMALMIGILAGVMILIAQLPIDKAIVAAGALETLLWTLAGVLSIVTKTSRQLPGDMIGTVVNMMIIILVLIIPLLAALWALTKLADGTSTEALAVAAASLAILLPEIALILAVIKAIRKVPSPKEAGKIALVLTAILAPIVAALVAAKAFIPDPRGIIAISTAIAEIITALLIPFAVISLLGKFLGAAAMSKGAVGFFVITFFATIIAALLGLISTIDGSVEFFQAAVPIAQAIGEAIGAIIGGLIGGVVEAIGDAVFGSLPNWGEDIRLFMEKVSAAIDIVNAIEVKQEALDAIRSFAETMLIFSTSEFINTISRLLSILPDFFDLLTGGGEGEKGFAEQAKELGKGLANFANETKDIDAAHAAEAAKAIEALAYAAEALGREGGFLEVIRGKARDLGQFGKELADGKEGFQSFVTDVVPILSAEGVSEKIEAAGKAIGSLAAAAEPLGRQGGLWELIVGRATTLAEFAQTLADGGPNFLAFAKISKDISGYSSHVEVVTQMLNDLVTLSNSLDTDMSMFGGWLYNEETRSLTDVFGDIIGTGSGSLGITSWGKYVNSASEGFSGLKKLSTEIGDDSEIHLPTDSLAYMLSQFGKQMSVVNIEELQHAADCFNVFASLAEGEFGTIDLGQVGLNIGALFTAFSIGSDGLVTFAESFTSTIQQRLASFALSYKYIAEAESLYTIPSMAGSAILYMSQNLSEAAKNFKYAQGALSLVDFTSFDPMFQWVAQYGNQLIEVGKNSVAGMWDEMVSQASLDAPTKTGEILGEFRDELSSDITLMSLKAMGISLGSSLVEGFVAGIENEIGQVTQMAARLSEATIRTMRRVLRIESPSRVMRKIGGYTGEGFVLGLEDYIGASEVAGNELAESATNSAIGVLDYIQDLLNGDLSVDMTIRPVLDLTNVQSGVQQIDSMFSQRQAILAQADADAFSNSAEIAELISVSWKILREIQNGRDIYLDGRIVSNVVNERLGRMEG